MARIIRKRANGQTALEYALVVGVIAVAVIFTAKAIFGGKESAAEKLMNKAVQSAQSTIATE
jgi:Flp pilus assembly pilin Flp